MPTWDPVAENKLKAARRLSVREGVQRGDEWYDDWYYVLARPGREDIRSYEFSSLLAEAELDLQEHEKRNVLLVPALPD